MSRIAQGIAAGAVGTTLLNTVTYLDMAVRGGRRARCRMPTSSA